ncbi:MAG: M23 family metallopeptidase [Clostridia bacterium]|nr:M23 family metallopeptidase [Clostridia bacterium]MDD4386346.1 M23 family metallopeptidase [Clostridia bacterium]
MENVISARRLRKSVLNSVGEVDLELYNLNRTNPYRTNSYKNKTFKSLTSKEDIKLVNFKTKLIVKLFICSVILFSIILSKMFFLQNIKNNSEIVMLYNHYITDFSKVTVLEKLEFRINKFNLVIDNIIPNKIKEYINEKYFNSIKPYILTFDLKTNFKELINLDNNKIETISENKIIETVTPESSNVSVKENDEVLNGIGGAEPLENKTVEVISSISIMDIDIQLIKSKNVSIISPVNGVVTSRYGVRQEVFPGVDPYHTGIDIANKKKTEILSATNGIVTKVEYDNKYYGNFIEITENEIIFKYGHLDSINVKQGNIVKQKDNIGLMGNTGMSTGTHLHFEIRINDRTVNPEELLKF